MRFRRLTIAGFRGFADEVSFDLDADVVVISGLNGSGKTSLFDALLWGLTGAVPRVGKDDALKHQYPGSGETRVELEMVDASGAVLRITRRFDGVSNLTVETADGTVSRGSLAEGALLNELWPDALLASDPVDAFRRTITRAVYLQQDEVREFVQSDSDRQRFDVVSELIGAGRVGELQSELERGRKAWTTATNSLIKESEPVRDRISRVKERLARLGVGATLGSAAGDNWTSWLSRVREQLPTVVVSDAAANVSADLDRLLRDLGAAELSATRRVDSLAALRLHLSSLSPASGVDSPSDSELTQAEEGVKAATAALRKASDAAAEARRRALAFHERAHELQALASLALRHLDDGNCPVCDQSFDKEAVEARLQSLVAATESDDGSVASEDGVAAAATALEVARQREAELRHRGAEAARERDARDEWQQRLQALALVAGLGEDVVEVSAGEVEIRAAVITREVDALRSLRVEGEALGLELGRIAESGQRTQLEEELLRLTEDLERQDREIELRQKTGALATSLIEALRGAGQDLVTAELRRIEPLLQRIYATVDPHPSFRVVNFLTRSIQGHHRLYTSVVDQDAEVSVEEPATVLSSSQLNVLAASAFLALNMAVTSLPLRVVALDDPLQSLDTINLLGLADLLRRIKESRQVLVSTHDEQLAKLLVRKLRPVGTLQRTREVTLAAWTPRGPEVVQRDVPSDESPLRLIASG